MQQETVKAIHQATEAIVKEVDKVIIGKDDVVRKVLMSILANGHVLLDDVPGVGKTSPYTVHSGCTAFRHRRILCIQQG